MKQSREMRGGGEVSLIGKREDKKAGLTVVLLIVL
jgi:hypothetical protein